MYIKSYSCCAILTFFNLKSEDNKIARTEGKINSKRKEKKNKTKIIFERLLFIKCT